MSNLKVEGKVVDFCPKCKNSKIIIRERDGKDFVVLSGVKCEDPYDGMIKTLDANSDICCSMFTPKPDRACEKRLRKSNEKLKKELEDKIKDLTDTNKYLNEKSYKREEELEKNINLLLDENKCLKLRNDNQVTMIQGLKLQYNDLSEKLERVESHDKALTKHFQNDEALINNIQKVIFPQEECSDYTYSYDEILDKVKEFKSHNSTMYEDLKYWKERCHKAETDVTILNSKVEVLEKKFRKVDSIRDAIWNEKELNQKISDLTESNENLKKMVERRDRWVEEFKSDVYTLQNEILTIRNIAQKAYDDTNRD